MSYCKCGSRRRAVTAGAMVAAVLFGATSLRAAPAEAAPDGSVFQQEPLRFQLPPRDKAYVETTPEPRQVEADKIFQQGNRRFEKRQLDDAIRLYQKAYALWPHPIILFNMAINLGFLSNPLGAARMFRKVLAYRPGPISPERYQEAAEQYRKLMRQLSTLRVVCQDPGAEVFVDGKSFGKAPIDKTVTLLPGRHMVAARQKDKVPYSAELSLKPGHHGQLNVALQAFVDVVKTRVVTRYHWWIPAAASAVAAVAAAAGAGIWTDGRSTIGDLKRAQLAALTDSEGVPITYDRAAERDAKGLQVGGQVLVGVAVTATAAAVVLWILRKKREKFTVEMKATPGGGGVSLGF